MQCVFKGTDSICVSQRQPVDQAAPAVCVYRFRHRESSTTFIQFLQFNTLRFTGFGSSSSSSTALRGIQLDSLCSWVHSKHSQHPNCSTKTSLRFYLLAGRLQNCCWLFFCCCSYLFRWWLVTTLVSLSLSVCCFVAVYWWKTFYSYIKFVKLSSSPNLTY